jgi:hypothetical protein
MQVITGKGISEKCDYSFGDHRGLWDKDLPGVFSKEANAHNTEFLEQAKQFEGKTMTLYIDNIRLYPRPLQVDREEDKNLVNYLFSFNNLLALCSLMPRNTFVIYTGEEDTPIDEYIQIPPNVKHIYAVNAVYNNDRITPIPFGLQRQMNPNDYRLGIIKAMIDTSKEPTKLLYINMGIGRNIERKPLAEYETNDWITTRFDAESKFFPYDQYADFLNELRDHKFVVCPKGHGFDTHRIWETLYMRRVPVMLRHPYFEILLKSFPVLFVDKWQDITKELLEQNDGLYQTAQTMNLDNLDLNCMMNLG